MKRPLLWIIACAVLALGVCGSPAPGRGGRRLAPAALGRVPDRRDPEPTPTAERGEPAPRRAAAPAEDDGGGMQSGMLIALLVAAAGLGALAAHTTSRRLRRRGKSAAERAAASASSGRDPRPSAARAGRAAGARPRKSRAPRPEAKPGNGAAKRRATQPLVEPVRDAPARRAEKPPAPPVVNSRSAEKPPRPARGDSRPAVNSRPAADAAPLRERRFPPSDRHAGHGPRSRPVETCRIKVQTRSIKSYFYAIAVRGRAGPGALAVLQGRQGRRRLRPGRRAARAGRRADRRRLVPDRRGPRAVGPALPARRRGAAPDHAERSLTSYSHSIVPGGFDVMSSTTRLTSRISSIMREAICSSRS